MEQQTLDKLVSFLINEIDNFYNCNNEEAETIINIENYLNALELLQKQEVY